MECEKCGNRDINMILIWFKRKHYRIGKIYGDTTTVANFLRESFKPDMRTREGWRSIHNIIELQKIKQFACGKRQGKIKFGKTKSRPEGYFP